jgi:dihydroxyacetone kinase
MRFEMLDVPLLRSCVGQVVATMEANLEYLTQLDSIYGDGDLGISMTEGFQAVARELQQLTTPDLGMAFLAASKAMNSAAPSTMGTIYSFGFLGIAKSLKGKEEATLGEFVEALTIGLELIMERAGSKEGEKTILDVLFPVVRALNEYTPQRTESGPFHSAREAAKNGFEATKGMVSVHGRAAYYREKTLTAIDGGAYSAMLLLESLQGCLNTDTEDGTKR